MKNILLLLMLLVLGISSCEKKDIAKNDDTVSDENRYISLDDAIKNEERKMSPDKYSLKNKIMSSVSSLSATNFTTNNSGNCSSYPKITDFRINNSVGVYGNDSLHGGGLALRHQFKKGKTYIIKFRMSKLNYYNTGDGVTFITSFPKLQVGLANENNFPTSCNSYVDLSTLNIPYSNVPDIAGQNQNMKSTAEFTENSEIRTITLLAQECFDYLWFNAIPAPGRYNVDIGIMYLEINEVAQSFSFSKTSDFQDANGATFKVIYNGFIVDHPFEWTTTGNLQIVGDNVGNSVQVKVVGSNLAKGKVIASIPGCGTFAEQTFDVCADEIMINASIDGPGYLYTNHHNNNDQEFYLRLNPGENFTITQLICDRAQVELFYRDGNIFKLRIPKDWNFIATSYQDYFTITIKGIDGHGCERYISKLVLVYPDPSLGGNPGDPQMPGS